MSTSDTTILQAIRWTKSAWNAISMQKVKVAWACNSILLVKHRDQEGSLAARNYEAAMRSALAVAVQVYNGQQPVSESCCALSG